MIGMVLIAASSFLPEADLDLYLSKPPPPVTCAADMLDYPLKLLPFDETQTFLYRMGERLEPLEMQPGYLVSECELLRMTNAIIELKRLKLDVKAIRQLRNREFELWRIAEKQYQRQIAQLTTPDWWTRNKLLVGIAVGAAAMAVTTWTSAQLLR